MLPLLLSNKPAFFGSLGAALLSLIAAILIPRVTMNAIDDALIARTSSLAPYVWILLGLAVFRAILTYGYRTRSTGWRTGSSTTCARSCTGTSPACRSRSTTACSRDSSSPGPTPTSARVQMFLTFAPLIALNLVSFVVALAFMFTISVALTLVALCPIPFVYVLGRAAAQPDLPAVVDRAGAHGRRRHDRRRERERRPGRAALRRRAARGRRAGQRRAAAAVGLGADRRRPGPVRAADGEPAPARPGGGAALRRMAGHRRRSSRSAPSSPSTPTS